MAESDTTRFGLRRWSADTDTPARTEFDTAHANIEAFAAGFTKGTLASRPTAGAAFDRWFYLATDGTPTLYYCDGAVWRMVATLYTGVTLDMNGEDLREPNLAAYTERIVTAANTTGGTYAMDLAVANVFDVTMSVATTFSFTNVPSDTAKSTTVTLVLRNGATAYAATWPSGIKWAGGTAPTLTGVNKADLITLVTFDGGTTWAGTLVQDFASLGV